MFYRINVCVEKVLDEFNAVFDQIETSIDRSRPIARSHEILTELRDISSMAMEHFDEHILPLLKKKSVTDSSSNDLFSK